MIPEKLLFDEVPCFISVQARDGKILNANRLFRDTFGSWEGKYCYELYKKRTEKCPDCFLDNIFEDGKIYESEKLVFAENGTPIQVSVKSAPIFDDNGKVIAVMEMSSDISETKRLQRLLQDSIDKYHTLYDEVPCYISVQDKDFKIIDENKRFKDEFGGKVGDYCYEIYKHRDSRCEICPVAESFKDGKIHSSEEIIASKDGEPMNTLVLASPIKDHTGKIVSVMEMSTDITAIKKMQSQMADVGQFVSSLAHTIKGIITGLEGGIYVVESGFKKNQNDVIKNGWGMVQRNVERVSNLVLDMLYYAKSRTPEKSEIDLPKLCRDVGDLFKVKLEENNIEIEYDLEDVEKLKGDSKAIHTLILTLLENAIDACRWDKPGKAHIVKVTLRFKDDMYNLSISDNGLGISKDNKAKLFTSMYSTKGSSGSGFGLMVVKKIVDEHKGRIEVESVEGEGTMFKVLVPPE